MAVERKVFTMRLPPNDYDKIKILSSKNKRSMAAEIEYILEMYLEKYELQNGLIFVEEKSKANSAVHNRQIGNNNLFVNTGNNPNSNHNKFINVDGQKYGKD